MIAYIMCKVKFIQDRGLTLCNIKLSAEETVFCFTAMSAEVLAVRRGLLVG